MSWKTWKVVLITLAAMLGVAGVAWWLTNPRLSDERQIENLVAKVEHGVETKHGREIMECVSPEYRDSSGLDRLEVLKLVNHWVRSPEQADVFIEDYDIKVAGAGAVGHFLVQVYVEGESLGRNPLQMDLTVAFEKRWRKLRRVWLVRSVEGTGFSAAPEDYL